MIHINIFVKLKFQFGRETKRILNELKSFSKPVVVGKECNTIEYFSLIDFIEDNYIFMEYYLAVFTVQITGRR